MIYGARYKQFELQSNYIPPCCSLITFLSHSLGSHYVSSFCLQRKITQVQKELCCLTNSSFIRGCSVCWLSRHRYDDSAAAVWAVSLAAVGCWVTPCPHSEGRGWGHLGSSVHSTAVCVCVLRFGMLSAWLSPLIP